MSLLSQKYTKYAILKQTISSDSRGGKSTTWTESNIIDAAVVLTSTEEIRTADRIDIHERHTIITPRRYELHFHDVIKRIDDGKCFRVTSDGDENYTPQSASLDMRAVSAEEFKDG